MFLTVWCYVLVISQSFIAKANYTISMACVHAFIQPLKGAKIKYYFSFLFFLSLCRSKPVQLCSLWNTNKMSRCFEEC